MKRRRSGDHVLLPSPGKSSFAWAAGPDRQPLLLTLHKQAALFRLTAFTLQAAYFSVG